jgi:hypothetical protein
MSKIEVNAVEPQSGTTLTLGASGDTVALAAGASQTGFGRAGSVNWSSTIRSSNFTAVSGNGYYTDTSAGQITVTLPVSPADGDIVAIKDWSSTAATNKINIARNGQKIEGNTSDGAIVVHGDAQTLVFSGASRGWMIVASGLLEGIQGPEFIVATGGTVLTCGNFKTHIFTASGCFQVTCAGNDLGSNSVEYMVVAGGAGGGSSRSTVAGKNSAGGGAGGFRQNYPSPTIAGLPVTATTYPITIGGGGTGSSSPSAGGSGTNSIFSTITSAGGGGGGSNDSGGTATEGSGAAGGSGGGGAGAGSGTAGSGGAGNTPPVSPAQGFIGGNGVIASCSRGAGGGGGGGAAGANATPTSAGNGGVGSYWPNPLFGPTAPSYGTTGPVPDVRYFAGGGGGAVDTGTMGSGGAGGGGGGVTIPQSPIPGTINTGGGGGGTNGGGTLKNGGNGGSGIVVIRYKYQ